MRKKIVLIMLILLSVFYLVDINQRREIQMTFNEDESFDNYQEYLLDISSLNVNTNNILDYFSGMIIAVYPYINPIYTNFIDAKKFVFNNSISDQKNIDNFISYYQMYLTKNALNSEIEKIRFNGIKINKIKVYTTKSVLSEVLNLYPNIKIVTN